MAPEKTLHAIRALTAIMAGMVLSLILTGGGIVAEYLVYAAGGAPVAVAASALALFVLLGGILTGSLAFSHPAVHGLALGLLWLGIRASTWPIGGMLQPGLEIALAAGFIGGGVAGGLIGGQLRRQLRG
jgi:hypothetical protein